MTSIPRPAAPGKPSVVHLRVSHFLSLGFAFLASAEQCVPRATWQEPAYRRVLAFTLHQAAEFLLSAVLAFMTPEERKRAKDARTAEESAALRSHDLLQLRAFALLVCPEIKAALPIEAGEDARIFDLLSSAYVRARYAEKRWSISARDVEQLLERVKLLGEAASACVASAVEGEVKS